VTFNNKGIVVEWNDLANVLKVFLGNPKVGSTFTLGSTKEDVIRAMGTPTGITVYQALGKEEWHYSYSTVTFNNKGIVVEWNDLANVLKVFLGNPKAGSTFTLGSTKEDVIKAMGTPTSINVYQALGKEEWHYSYSTVTFNNKGIVVEWNDLANVLKLR
jgi:outer membrane protein assembly factor BamE (lipoprotein component of BamABCDE complex)